MRRALAIPVRLYLEPDLYICVGLYHHHGPEFIHGSRNRTFAHHER